MKTKLLLVCLIWIQAAVGQYEHQVNFLRERMSNFGTWLNVNNLDPSPVQPDELYFETQNSVSNLKCNITNHRVRGHSRNVVIKDVSFNFNHLTFKVDLDLTENITFYGEYNVTGTVNSVNPISSNGNWSITVPAVSLRSFEAQLFCNINQNQVTVRSFNLTEINLSGKNGFQIHFESLLQQPGVIGYEEYVESALFDGFATQILSSNQDPLRTLYTNFLKEMFQNAIPSEFIYAQPPATTPATPSSAYTTTTKLPTTTSNPRVCPETGIDLIPHPTSCSKYFLCVEGTAYEQDCADELHFNPVIKACDFPENINCTKPLPECRPEGVSFHPYPGNCSLYAICAEGTPLVRQCAEETCFDPEELKCRVNESVSFDIPKLIEINHESDVYKKSIVQCQSPVSQGIILIRSLYTAQKFSVCDKGLYKATFVCPTGSMFDQLLQDCKTEEL